MVDFVDFGFSREGVVFRFGDNGVADSAAFAMVIFESMPNGVGDGFAVALSGLIVVGVDVRHLCPPL